MFLTFQQSFERTANNLKSICLFVFTGIYRFYFLSFHELTGLFDLMQFIRQANCFKSVNLKSKKMGIFDDTNGMKKK